MRGSYDRYVPEHRTTTRIQAPLSEVFAVFSNPQEAAKYLTRVQRVELLPDGAYREWRTLENGTEIVQDFRVVELVPGRSCTLVSISSGVRFEFHSTFGHESGETTVTILATARAVTLGARVLLPLIWWFVGPVARKSLASDLEELQAGLERPRGTGPIDTTPAST
jgi:uncharacterized protein YndB with AHSA1/START domain